MWFPNRHSFPVSTIAMYSSHHAGHNKHQACSSRTPPREIDFSDVSLKTLLVLVLRSIFHPSHVHLLGGFIGSPNFIIASRNGYRQSSRPHRCLPQRLASNQSVGGRLGNHNAASHWFIRTDDRAKRNDFIVSSASITMFSTSLSVSLYAIHTRTSPPNSIHRHVLQTFALPWRAIASPPGEQYTFVGTVIWLTGFNSLCVPR